MSEIVRRDLELHRKAAEDRAYWDAYVAEHAGKVFVRERVHFCERMRRVEAYQRALYGWHNWFWNRGRCDESNMGRWARQKSWRRVF